MKKHSSGPNPLTQLQSACAPIHRMGNRRRQKAARALMGVLRSDGADPAAVVRAVMGADPLSPMTARDALAELRRMSIRVNLRWLYRRAEKAGDATLRIWVTRAGDWDTPKSPTLRHPRAEVTIYGKTKRFVIAHLSFEK